MRTLTALFANNRAWAADMERRRPGFFGSLVAQQAPRYLWIGCSDSRVPANEIVGLLPGELFVHRNVANVVAPDDVNCLAVVQYAVESLRVRDIIVCGHYGCGGVAAALGGPAQGYVESWLEHVRHSCGRHEHALAGPAQGYVESWLEHVRHSCGRHEHALAIPDGDQRLRRCCELNVLEQVRNLCLTPILQAAWQRKQDLAVHGWIYDLHDGLLRDLGLCVTAPGELDALYRAAVAQAR